MTAEFQITIKVSFKILPSSESITQIPREQVQELNLEELQRRLYGHDGPA